MPVLGEIVPAIELGEGKEHIRFRASSQREKIKTEDFCLTFLSI